MDSKTAQKRFEMENNIVSASDDIYKYDYKAQMEIREARPWKKEYFSPINLSYSYFLALIILQTSEFQELLWLKWYDLNDLFFADLFHS